MKKITFNLLLCLLCFGGITQAQDAVEFSPLEKAAAAIELPQMTFEKKFVDFGEVKRGEKRQTSYEFTNTGKVPLQIDLISACDCTTTDYPRREILPGEKGTISVIFDSTEKEESEVIDIDIYLRQTDPETGAPIFEMVQYKYDLIK